MNVIVKGSNSSMYLVKDREKAKDLIAGFISDAVYERLGGDDEFLYDDKTGELLPDEEIVDDMYEILSLGEGAGFCEADENGIWRYAAGKDDFLNYAIIDAVSVEEQGRLWFVPKGSILLHYEEGDGGGLLPEDIEDGYITYLNWTTYSLREDQGEPSFTEENSGMVLMKKPYCEYSTEELLKELFFEADIEDGTGAYPVRVYE